MSTVTRSGRRALLLAIVGLLAAALAVPAFAQTADDDAGGGTDAPAADDAVSGMRETFVAALAEELDLPEAQVDEALSAVRERLRAEHEDRFRDRLDDAVAEGALTQEQADAIAEAAEAGVLRRGHRGFGHHGGFGGGSGAPGGPPAGDGAAAGFWGADQA